MRTINIRLGIQPILIRGTVEKQIRLVIQYKYAPPNWNNQYYIRRYNEKRVLQRSFHIQSSEFGGRISAGDFFAKQFYFFLDGGFAGIVRRFI